MDKEVVKKRLLDKSENGKITCKDALAVAEELGVPPTGFAQLLTGMDIKIEQCQLSCFP